jgi:hypothetical protein
VGATGRVKETEECRGVRGVAILSVLSLPVRGLMQPRGANATTCMLVQRLSPGTHHEKLEAAGVVFTAVIGHT